MAPGFKNDFHSNYFWGKGSVSFNTVMDAYKHVNGMQEYFNEVFQTFTAMSARNSGGRKMQASIFHMGREVNYMVGTSRTTFVVLALGLLSGNDGRGRNRIMVLVVYN